MINLKSRNILYLILLLVSTNLSAQNIIIIPNIIITIPNANTKPITIDTVKINEICRDYKLVKIDKGEFGEMNGKSNQVKENRLGNLCSDIKYFARLNKKLIEQENVYGTWIYDISYNSDESIITITGKQATALPRIKKYIYKEN